MCAHCALHRRPPQNRKEIWVWAAVRYCRRFRGQGVSGARQRYWFHWRRSGQSKRLFASCFNWLHGTCHEEPAFECFFEYAVCFFFFFFFGPVDASTFRWALPVPGTSFGARLAIGCFGGPWLWSWNHPGRGRCAWQQKQNQKQITNKKQKTNRGRDYGFSVAQACVLCVGLRLRCCESTVHRFKTVSVQQN